jgi:hypothetical protein
MFWTKHHTKPDRGRCERYFFAYGENEKKREAGGQGEFSVGLAARRDASPMSRHNQQSSVEEGSLLGGTHAMKSVKPSVDILEGLSNGVSMGVFRASFDQQMVE